MHVIDMFNVYKDFICILKLKRLLQKTEKRHFLFTYLYLRTKKSHKKLTENAIIIINTLFLTLTLKKC